MNVKFLCTVQQLCYTVIYLYISLHSTLNTGWRLALEQFPRALSDISGLPSSLQANFTGILPQKSMAAHDLNGFEIKLLVPSSTETHILSAQRISYSIPNLVSLEYSRSSLSVQECYAPVYKMKFQSLCNLEFFLLHNGVTERDLSHLWPILTLCRTHMPLPKGIFPDTEDIMQFLAAYSRNLSHVERLLHYLFFFSIF